MRARHPPSVLLLGALVLGACSPAGAETAPEVAIAIEDAESPADG